MNKRERILVIVICGMGALVLVRTGVGMYRTKIKDLQNTVDRTKAKLSKTELAVEEERVARERWAEIGEQTLSKDPNEIINLMREELVRLTKEAGLDDASVNPGGVKRAWGKTEVRALYPKVRAEGTMAGVLKFLFALHRQPYLMRCKKLSITPIVNRERDGKRTTTGRLKLSADLETLLLPSSKETAEFEINPEGLEEVPKRLAFASYDDYAKGIPDELFRVWVPPPPPPTKASVPKPTHRGKQPEGRVTLRWKPGQRATRHIVHFGEKKPPPALATQPAASYVVRETLPVGKTYYWKIDEVGVSGTTVGDLWTFTMVKKSAVPPVTKPPRPAGPPKDAQLVLGRILSWPGGQQVVLESAAKKGASDDKRVAVGEPLFGGTLIMVHPKGAVSEQSDGTRKFHPVGLPLNQGKPLTAEAYPAVFHELRQREQRAGGISQSPGVSPAG